MSLAFSSKQRDAVGNPRCQIGWNLGEHCKTTRHVKAANHDIDPGPAQRTSNIQSARELIRLHPYEPDKSEILIAGKSRNDGLQRNTLIGLIDRRDFDVDIWAENLPLSGTAHQGIDGGKRVRRHCRAPPPNYISVVVIM